MNLGDVLLGMTCIFFGFAGLAFIVDKVQAAKKKKKDARNFAVRIRMM